MKKLATVIAAIMVAAIGFFAWHRQKDEDELDTELDKRRRALSPKDMDEAFAHDLTPADPAQIFRNSGAV